MAWIESHQNLKEHPKLYLFLETLKVSKPQAVGHLHLLWWWCVDYAPEGVLKSFSDIQIARASCWEGDAKVFVTALIDSGFVDRRDGVLTIHDWSEFRLHYDLIVERRERQKDQVRERVRKFRELKRGSNALVTQSNAPTKPNITKPNITKPNKPAKAAVVIPEVPEDLIQITESITKWLAYKKERRESYKGPIGLGHLWDDLRKIPPDKRADAISYSMRKGWKGVYEENGGNNDARAGSGSGKGGSAVVGEAKPKPGAYDQFSR